MVSFLQKYFCIESWNYLTTFQDNWYSWTFLIILKVQKNTVVQIKKVKVLIILWETWIYKTNKQNFKPHETYTFCFSL